MNTTASGPKFKIGDRVTVKTEHRYSLGAIQPHEIGVVRSLGLVDFTHAVVGVNFRREDGSVVHASIRPENLQHTNQRATS